MTTDAGKTWIPVKGAPGGDDYHQLWINPKDGNRMVLSSDQGTVVSVDGAKTWSTWYNQPTAQIYHVAADNRFPYWLYGAQQDSGGVGVSTLSSARGVLSFRNWEPTCEAGESATVLPDPKDGNILYGQGTGRCDQNLNVAVPLGGQLPEADPNDPNRKTWTLPQVFSLADEALYYANQFVMRSRDRGKTCRKRSAPIWPASAPLSRPPSTPSPRRISISPWVINTVVISELYIRSVPRRCRPTPSGSARTTASSMSLGTMAKTGKTSRRRP